MGNLVIDGVDWGIGEQTPIGDCSNYPITQLPNYQIQES
jgi:hypothetical protein